MENQLSYLGITNNKEGFEFREISSGRSDVGDF